ncbi:MAG: sugar phosphate isomerase/epimerase [Clostridia bacterium]|nr:sugar phosphate isomerase/epimerase [Clostridia bacterium]
MNKLGIFMNFWEKNWNADHKKYIVKAAKLGFDVLEFQAQPLLDMPDDYLRELKKIADDNNIEMTYSLGLDKAYDISSDDASVREKGIEYLTNIMKKVNVMGGKIISGVSYAGWGVPAIEDIEKERLTLNSITSMKKLAQTANELDIVYGVEAVNRFEGVVLNTAKEAVDYVNAVGSKNVGVLLDTYHMNIEEASIGDAIRTAGDKLVGLHVGENNRSVPGRGHLDWDEIFEALKAVDFKGRIVAEPFVVKGGEVGRDIYVWRNLVTSTDEESLDKEALFMLDFERKMLEKWGL